MTERQTIVLIIWIAGIIPGYLSFKRGHTMAGDEWTVGLRRIGIFAAFAMSWFNIIVLLFFMWMEYLNNDKKANW